MTKRPRKVCFLSERTHYARRRLLLDVLRKDPRIELQLVVGGSILLDKYGRRFFRKLSRRALKYPIRFNVIDGGNHVAMAKTAGLTALEFSNSLHKLQPDVVLIRGDRFEQLALAMVAAYQNKIVAHIEGGEKTGTIDESVRHAITKLAHLHFTSTDEAKKRVVQMGENPKNVWNVGSPDIEYASGINKKIDSRLFNRVGVGAPIDFKKPYIVVVWHPVTTEDGNAEHTEKLLKVVDGRTCRQCGSGPINMLPQMKWRGHPSLLIWLLKNNLIRFVTDKWRMILSLLKKAGVMVGNSSAGIKEASYLSPCCEYRHPAERSSASGNVMDAGYGRDV